MKRLACRILSFRHRTRIVDEVFVVWLLSDDLLRTCRVQPIVLHPYIGHYPYISALPYVRDCPYIRVQSSTIEHNPWFRLQYFTIESILIIVS